MSKMKKYSKGFERDWDFYITNVNSFNFCGTLNPRFSPIRNEQGRSAKDVFHKIQSEGINTPCYEPELLRRILLCQAGINFQIKQWAEGRQEGTLTLPELSIALANKIYPNKDFSYSQVLNWENGKAVYYKDIETQYGLPEWVITAVERQWIKASISKIKLTN